MRYNPNSLICLREMQSAQSVYGAIFNSSNCLSPRPYMFNGIQIRRIIRKERFQRITDLQTSILGCLPYWPCDTLEWVLERRPCVFVRLGAQRFLISDAKRSQGPPEGALTHVKTRGALMRIASGHCCISSSNAVLSSVRRRGTDGRASRCCRCGDRPSSLARSVQRDDDSVQPPASAQLAVSSIVLQAQIHLAATLHLYSVLD